MTPKPTIFEILRKTAAQKLINSSSPLNNRIKYNMKGILHELSVYQIELELQNESLIKTLNELKKSKEYYKELYDFAPAGYFTINESGFVKKVNFTGAKMLGIERHRLIGRAFVEFINPDSIDIFHNNTSYALKKGKKASCELKIIRNDKSEFYGRFDCVSLYKRKSNNCEDIIAILSDISKEKAIQIEKYNIEDHLPHPEKMQAIGRLAGGIAHDFNNQLCGIRGYTELLKDKVKDDPQCTKYLNIIFKSVERATYLTEQLLAYARKGKYLKKPIDMHDLINDVISLLSLNISQKIRVSVDQKAKQSQTIGDPNQLKNIILNIALNSCDAMQQGGILSFKTENVELDQEWCRSGQNEIEPGKYLKISITDTGVGMDEETQKHMFDPFFTKKEVGKGTGMGLAVVYGAIKDHKGAIQVTSQVGEGTDLVIYLPQKLQDNNLDKGLQNINTSSKKISGTILIVDDEEIVSSVTSSYFKQKGFTVNTCYNGVQAVIFYKKNWEKIDLIILDMIMPIMNGQEAFEELVKINPKVKVILSSGYYLPEKTQELLNKGALGFAPKPYKLEELYRQVAYILNIYK